MGSFDPGTVVVVATSVVEVRELPPVVARVVVVAAIDVVVARVVVGAAVVVLAPVVVVAAPVVVVAPVVVGATVDDAPVVVEAAAVVVDATWPPTVVEESVPDLPQNTTWLISLSPVRPLGSEMPLAFTSANTPVPTAGFLKRVFICKVGSVTEPALTITAV